MSKTDPAKNRRFHNRYKYEGQHNRINTRVISIGISDCNFDDIRFTDFSYSGLGLASHLNIPIGTAMQLEMSVNDDTPVLLTAIISNRRKSVEGYRYGAFFEYDQDGVDDSIERTLIRVEQTVQYALEF